MSFEGKSLQEIAKRTENYKNCVYDGLGMTLSYFLTRPTVAFKVCFPLPMAVYWHFTI